MEELSINIVALKNEEVNLEQIYNILCRNKQELDLIVSKLALSGMAKVSVQNILKKCEADLESLCKCTKKFKNNYSEILTNYENTEKIILQTNVNDIRGIHIVKTEIANPTDVTRADNVDKEQEFIDNYEYTYAEDNIQVPIDIKFLDKNSCLAMADRIIAEHGENGKCNGMSRKRIAKELYAHAIGYYTGSALEGAGLDSDFVEGLMTSGEVADIGIGDGLELHYNIIWYWMDPFKLVD